MTEANARAATLALLAERAEGATICPSEVARALADSHRDDPTAPNWRDWMPMVHEAVDRLVAEGLVQLSWKGRRLAARNGPYRIRDARP